MNSKNRQFPVGMKISGGALGNGLAVPQKVTHRVTARHSDSTPRYIYSRKIKIYIHRKSCT